MKNSKGAALATTLFVMMVLSLLAIIIFDISIADTRHSIRNEKGIQAHFIARAGVNLGEKLLDQQLQANTYFDMATVVSGMNAFIASLQTSNPDYFIVKEGTVVQGIFTIQYEEVNSTTIKILSTGTIPGE